MGISSLQRFGQVPAELPLGQLHDYLSEGKYIADDYMVCHGTGKLTASNNGGVLDISTILDPFGDESDPMVAAGYVAMVYIFFDRRTQTKLELDYCGTSDGAAYSQTASYATNSMSGMMAWRWEVYADNYANNCKVKFRTTSTGITSVVDYTVVAFYRVKAAAS